MGDLDTKPDLQKLEAVLASLMDPEIPVISLMDLGIIRKIKSGPPIEVIITPTYSGCPATDMIENMIRKALDDNGFANAIITNQLSPAWTTGWISKAGREALKDYGIDPPSANTPACPRCGSDRVELISEFGSTPCKALYRCKNCLEPFDRFKCH